MPADAHATRNDLPAMNRSAWPVRREAVASAWRDLLYATRALQRHRGVTLVAALSLSLGLGANIAIFSVLDAVLLRSLPVTDAAALVVLSHHGKDAGATPRARFANVPLYEFIRDTNRSFSGVLAFSTTQLRMRRDETTIAIPAQWVSANYFAVLGVRAALGRTWERGDEDLPDVVVISDRLWRREFAADPAVVGRSITLNGRPVGIIGVLPPDCEGLIPGSPVDLTLLLAAQPAVQPAQGNLVTLGGGAKDEAVSTWPLFLVARLKPGVSASSAEAEASLLFRQWATHRGASEDYVAGAYSRATLKPAGKGLDNLRQRFAAPLWVLMAIVAGVLLIAGANVVNLLLVRGAARQHELAVRAALGASRGRLMRQLLSEGVLLTLLGGIGGIFVGAWGASALTALVATGRTPTELHARMDWHGFIFALTLALLCGAGVGLIPAWRISRRSTAATLNESSARGGERATGRWGEVLVVAQFALSLTLLVATGLFVGNLRQITGIAPGYAPDHLISVSFDWSAAGYNRAQMIDFVRRAAETVAALPEIEAAGATHLEPLGQQESQRWLTARGADGDGTPRVVEFNVVSSDYFRAMRLPVVRGRAFDSRDAADAPKVAMISETLARECFPDRDAVGQFVWIARDTKGTPFTVVGIVHDAKQRDIREAPLPMLFLPATQSTAWEMNLVARFRGDRPASTLALRQALTRVARDVPIRAITTPDAQMNRSLLQERMLASLSGFFGPLAMLLAAVGLYGLLAYHVTCRTREIGVRMALGASTRDVLRLVFWRGLRLVGIGTLLGLAGALLVPHVLRRFLYALSPYDPRILAGAVILLGMVAVAACLLPALRAARLDPSAALRDG